MIDYFVSRRSQVVLWLASLVFFILIALDVFFDGALTQFDRVVYHWSLGWHHPLLDRIVFGVTQLGSLRAVLFYSVAVLLFLFWKKARQQSIF